MGQRPKNLSTLDSKVTILISSIFVLLIISYFLMPRLFEQHYLRNYGDKLDLIKDESKKMIILGGSNVAFGLDSEMIKTSFPDYNVVNMGLHASLSIEYQLENIYRHLSKDDVLVLALEYEYFYRESNNIEFERLTSNINRLYLENYFIDAILYKVNKLTEGFVFSMYINNYSGVYKYGILNDYGDIIIHNERESKTLPLPNDITSRKLNQNFIHQLRFLDEIIENDIEVLITFPSITREYFDLNSFQINEVYNYITSFNLAVVSDPSNFTFDTDYFFDTHYHLNYSGKKLRTERLIIDIETFTNRN
jgi:hypothetical protein